MSTWSRSALRVKRKGSQKAGSTAITATDLGYDLNQFSLALKVKMMPPAVRAAGKIVKDKANIYLKLGAPSFPGDSRKSGTRYKWSKKTAAKRGGYSGAPSIVRKKDMLNRIRRKNYTAYAVVGPRYGKQVDGGHSQAHVLESGTNNHYWWGKKAPKALRARPFLGPAGKITRSQQVEAMRSKMASYLK